ncbi:pirin family protein [Vulgatibacter incomptus]|uniref:Pirin n=1 Tax=Vulgatibacter incomptus TaxID=1391653 RepID=A0A0K1PHL2_9BACT|nr:pirin family protein [Vulgatibacter incomptus]AKU92604.1 Pirin [Vulgatibacter incomptus]
MDENRRRFLAGSAAAAAFAVAGCQKSPVFLPRSGRRVERIQYGIPTSDGDGVRLTRVIGQPALRNLDPFLLLDRFHSDDPDAYIRGFPDHPHRGFETVTVMLEGRMRHRDSRGNHGVIGGGGAQWMTAGRGIIHSEMPEQEKGLMSGFQLWVNLPAREKMGPQFYQDLGPAQLAQGTLGRAGSRVSVISGELDGLVGPVRERPTQPLLFTAVLEDDRPFSIDTPEGHTAFVFVGSGGVEIGPDATPVPEGAIALLGSGRSLEVRSPSQRSEILVAAGKPLNEPIVQYGPFVMNTEAEIRQAFADYRAGVLDRG